MFHGSGSVGTRKTTSMLVDGAPSASSGWTNFLKH